MKKARYDVYKFGIKGLGKEEQENAKIQLAIKLGAKVNNFNIKLQLHQLIFIHSF